MFVDEFIDKHIEVSDVIRILDLASQQESGVPCVSVVSEVGTLRIDNHESILPSDLVKARIRPHDLGTTLSSM